MEIKIILILLFVHYLQLYIVKPKHNKLYCGIFAWSGKDPKKFNKDKFDKLGIFNIERGKDSCGISFDGEVYYGINTEKLYSNFIVNIAQNPKCPFSFSFSIVYYKVQLSYNNALLSEKSGHYPVLGAQKPGISTFWGCPFFWAIFRFFGHFCNYESFSHYSLIKF